MAKTYDAALKTLITKFPSDWAGWLGYGDAEPDVLNTDLSTVESSVDGLLKLREHPDTLAHIELQSSHDPGLIERELWHNILAWRLKGKTIETTIVYLRPEACPASHTGHFDIVGPTGTPVVHFRYRQVKIWESGTDELLARPGTMPLAPLARIDRDAMPSLIHDIERRIESLDRDLQGVIYTTTYALGGLRYDREFLDLIMRKVHIMKESVTYQAIQAEAEARGLAQGMSTGREDGLHRGLIAYGTARFGTPDSATRDAVEAIHDTDRLQRMFGNVTASSWAELLATP